MHTILVIDDNLDIRENISEILDLAGYKTYMAENGKRGVELAMEILPDVIICDIMMPELDGYGVLHLLRKNESTQSIPFIFLTAKTERSDFRRGMEMGADDYITKPFEDIELLNAVEIRLRKAKILKSTYEPTLQDVNRFIEEARSTNLIKEWEEKFEVINIARKQHLYTEGRKPRFLYYLISGKVKIVKSSDPGKEYVKDIFGPGDFVGVLPLLEEDQYSESAEVLEDVELLVIPKNAFETMIFTNIDVAVKFIQILSRNLKEKEDRMLNLAYSSLRKRVAKALIDIQDKFYASHPGKPLEISREDFAQYIGTATESLIRTLSDFKAEKLISIQKGKVIVANYQGLKNMIN